MRDDENNNRDDGRSWRQKDSGGGIETLDQAQSLINQASHSHGGIPSIAIGTDSKTGKSQVLGFTVSRNVATIARTLIANFVPWLSRSGGESIYNLAFKAAKGNPNAALYAKIGENIARWGVVGAGPMLNLVYANRLNARDRKELSEELAPVMSATKANAKNNEVIRIEFDALHDDMMMDLKLIAADLPTLVPQVLVGVRDQKAFYENKKHQAAQADLINQGLEERKRALSQDLRDRESLRQHVESQNPGLPPDIIEAYLDREIDRRERASISRQAHDSKDESQQQKDQWLVLGGSLVSEVFKDSIHERADKHRSKNSPWKMIKNLKRELEEQINRDSHDQYGGIANRSPDDILIDNIPLRDYIIAIFQQHERSRAKLNGEKTVKSETINPLGPALVEKMMPAVDMIAVYIADGRLDPDALVTLVGENKVVIHQPNGARSFAKIGDVKKTLDDLLAVMSTHEAIKPEEIFADFADPALVQNALKDALQAMQGVEKAYFVSLFPNDILEQAGMSKKDINDNRKLAHRNVYNIAAAQVLDICQKDPSQLKTLGLSEQQVAAVQDLAERINSGDEKAIAIAVDGRDKTVVGALRKVTLTEEINAPEKGGKFLEKIVSKARAIPAVLAEAKKRGEEEAKAVVPLEEGNLSDHHAPRARTRFADENGPVPLTDRASRDEEPVAPGVRR